VEALLLAGATSQLASATGGGLLPVGVDGCCCLDAAFGEEGFCWDLDWKPLLRERCKACSPFA